jgi:hypothetical protein
MLKIKKFRSHSSSARAHWEAACWPAIQAGGNLTEPRQSDGFPLPWQRLPSAHARDRAAEPRAAELVATGAPRLRRLDDRVGIRGQQRDRNHGRFAFGLRLGGRDRFDRSMDRENRRPQVGLAVSPARRIDPPDVQEMGRGFFRRWERDEFRADPAAVSAAATLPITPRGCRSRTARRRLSRSFADRPPRLALPDSRMPLEWRPRRRTEEWR